MQDVYYIRDQSVSHFEVGYAFIRVKGFYHKIQLDIKQNYCFKDILTEGGQ